MCLPAPVSFYRIDPHVVARFILQRLMDKHTHSVSHSEHQVVTGGTANYHNCSGVLLLILQWVQQRTL